MRYILNKECKSIIFKQKKRSLYLRKLNETADWGSLNVQAMIDVFHRLYLHIIFNR